jgi:hypothetical protein
MLASVVGLLGVCWQLYAGKGLLVFGASFCLGCTARCMLLLQTSDCAAVSALQWVILLPCITATCLNEQHRGPATGSGCHLCHLIVRHRLIVTVGQRLMSGA